MPEGEPHFYSSALRVAWRELSDRLNELPALYPLTLPQPRS